MIVWPVVRIGRRQRAVIKGLKGQPRVRPSGCGKALGSGILVVTVIGRGKK